MTGIIGFGPFRLVPAEHRLEQNGAPVPLGARALHLLVILAERAGEVVSKHDLMKDVWPGLVVDEANLRVHIAAVRKALADGQSGARYVITVPGRGYCLVAPTQRYSDTNQEPARPVPPAGNRRFPTQLGRIVGRDGAVLSISTHLLRQRFVTVVGPGGIGKTTAAIAAGHMLKGAFADEVYFLDFGTLNDPLLVPSALALTLGLSVQSSDPLPSLIRFLRGRRVLLVLDSCEHVIADAASAAERIFTQTADVHILATSRELLRVHGEHAYQLSSLGYPTEKAELTAAEAMAYPAVQLFVERVVASGIPFELVDVDARSVAEICRRLDGIALALELAASQVQAFGLQQTARFVGSQLALAWRGRRTAPIRHQTLYATLDWTHSTLSEIQRVVLRRLAIFVGPFTLEAACRIAADNGIDETEVTETIADLIAKSFVAASISTSTYRLLDTTRAYAKAKLEMANEATAVATLHAGYILEKVRREVFVGSSSPGGSSVAVYEQHVGDLRAALSWSLEKRGNVEIGIELTAAGSSTFTQMSLLTEGHKWAQLALSLLNETRRGGFQEMQLQGTLAQSAMLTSGSTTEVRTAFERALGIAEEIGDLEYQMRFLGGLTFFYGRLARFSQQLVFAHRCFAVARRAADRAGLSAADSFLGVAYHHTGNHLEARSHLHAATKQSSEIREINSIRFGVDLQSRARISLARTLWLLGLPDQAVTMAHQSIVEAEATGNPVALCLALIWAVPIFLWVDDRESAERSTERFIAQAELYSLGPYVVVGQGIKGQLAVRYGDARLGTGLLRSAIKQLHANQYLLFTTAFLCSIGEGLLDLGQFDAALDAINEAVDLAERYGDLSSLPELLRLKGYALFVKPDPDWAEAYFYLSQALDQASRQSALSWELRSATSMGRMLLAQKRADAGERLTAVYSRFTEGFETIDLKSARSLLAEMSSAA